MGFRRNAVIAGALAAIALAFRVLSTSDERSGGTTGVSLEKQPDLAVVPGVRGGVTVFVDRASVSGDESKRVADVVYYMETPRRVRGRDVSYALKTAEYDCVEKTASTVGGLLYGHGAGDQLFKFGTDQAGERVSDGSAAAAELEYICSLPLRSELTAVVAETHI